MIYIPHFPPRSHYAHLTYDESGLLDIFLKDHVRVVEGIENKDTLASALKQRGKHGFIFSVVDFARVLMSAPEGYDPRTLGGYEFSTQSYELLGIDHIGKLSPKGKPIVLVTHGIELVTEMSINPTLGGEGIEISEEIWENLLTNNEPHVYTLDKVPLNPPRCFGVAISLEQVMEYSDKSKLSCEQFADSHLMQARFGGMPLKNLFPFFGEASGSIRMSHSYEGVTIPKTGAYARVISITFNGMTVSAHKYDLLPKRYLIADKLFWGR
ncbi:MAG: hypothetical protein ABIJ34_09055 [archaeon]